jgi:hypothetical protein
MDKNGNNGNRNNNNKSSTINADILSEPILKLFKNTNLRMSDGLAILTS